MGASLVDGAGGTVAAVVAAAGWRQRLLGGWDAGAVHFCLLRRGIVISRDWILLSVGLYRSIERRGGVVGGAQHVHADGRAGQLTCGLS